jgi:hypothetical protein
MKHLCLKCQGIDLSEGRLSEGHLAHRFGDIGGIQVFLDGGGDIADWTMEAFGGRDGWVLMLCGDHPKWMHVCSACSADLCAVKRTGSVSIQRAVKA